MDIKSFVATTLVQIVEGVKDAQAQLGDSGAAINVRGVTAREKEVEFDIAVTTTEGSDAGGGISVWGVGAKGSISSERSNVSRIKFVVPIVLPRG